MRTDPVSRRPDPYGRAAGIGAGLLAALLTGLAAPTGGLLALGGVAILGVGLVPGSRRTVSMGAIALLGGVLYAGLAGARPLALLLATAGTVLAWDLGGVACDLGAEVGREAVARRSLAIHALASVAVSATAIGVGYGAYLVAVGGQSVVAVLLLLLGGLALVATLDYA